MFKKIERDFHPKPTFIIKMEHKKKLYWTIGITLLIVLAFVGVMIKMIQENGECVDAPFEYSAQKLEESGGDYMCGCRSLDPELLDFSFNSDGIEIIEGSFNIIIK